MTSKRKWLHIVLLLITGIILGIILCIIAFSDMSFVSGRTTKAVPKKIEFITNHTLCKHESTYIEESDIQAAFSNKDEIKNAFPEWNLISVSDDKIVLKKQVANYCPHHYFAYLENKKIHIETLNGDKKDILNVAAFKFSEQEEKTLNEGVYLNGKEMYTAFIEDFTS